MRIVCIDPLVVLCEWCGATFEITPVDLHSDKHRNEVAVDCPVCGKALLWACSMKGGGEIMAEFTEVMAQMRRMCSKYGCNCFKCPLSAFGDCMLIFDDDKPCDSDYAKIEDIVLQWVKENPEPVYPSWVEVWKQLFPDAAHIPCPEVYFGIKCGDKCCDVDDKCSVCRDNPIPAEIAKKLDIKPKEASE